MTPQQVLDQARYLTKSSSTDNSAADADCLRILNEYIQKQSKELINLNDDKFGVKATTNLNVNPNQEDYAMPSDCWKVKRAEITYNGSSYYPIEMVDDVNTLDFSLDATTINQRFTQSNPKASVFGNNIYLRPIPSAAITAGLRIWYIRQPVSLSAISGTTITLPSEYHGALAYGLGSEIALRQGDQGLSDRLMQQYLKAVEDMKRTFAPRITGKELNFKAQIVNYD
jgi:hypothetical protein